MELGVGSALFPKIAGENEPAESFENLDWPHPQHSFKELLSSAHFNFAIHVSMAPRFEIRKTPEDERISRNEPVVNGFAVNRLKRCHLLSCKDIRLKER